MNAAPKPLESLPASPALPPRKAVLPPSIEAQHAEYVREMIAILVEQDA